MNRKTPITFKSGLAEQITGFIAQKRNLGYKYNHSIDIFRTFDNFCLNYECNNHLPKELALEWVKKKPNQSHSTVRHYLCAVRQLALFMQRNGFEAYVVPAFISPKQTHEHVPYIFRHEEIQRLFKVIDNLKPNPSSPNRHLAFPVLFRILYCCGLRVSEALTLRLKDVDLNQGVIKIINAKMYRDRLVPMDYALTEKLRLYIEKVEITNGDSLLFPSPTTQEPYVLQTIRQNFREFLWYSRINYGGQNTGPRVHDLRHTFSVHCLQKFVSEGKDLNAVIPILSTYLGHKSCVGTSRYLHLTAEVYPEIAVKLESLYGQILPEWVGDIDEAY